MVLRRRCEFLIDLIKGEHGIQSSVNSVQCTCRTVFVTIFLLAIRSVNIVCGNRYLLHLFVIYLSISVKQAFPYVFPHPST